MFQPMSLPRTVGPSGSKPPLSDDNSKSGVARSSLRKSSTPSVSGASITKLGVSKSGAAPTKKDLKGSKKELEFQLPPMSLPISQAKEINFDELKKKTIRRNAPPGEDKKGLANIIRNLKNQKIKVHEFVNMIAPYTGDNGDVMRRVIEDDLTSFRRLVSKIYDTMTQDVSDVLVNEQLQTANYYQERCDMFNQKMLNVVSEIYKMAPNFDFEKYHRDKEEHLSSVLPLPTLIQHDAEDVEMQKRQEAFHRLQWLKIEGKRLMEENQRLHKRLAELRRLQKIEQQRAVENAAAVEAKKQELEAEEAQKEEMLVELSDSVGKAMIRSEAFVQLEEEMDIRQSMISSMSVAEHKKAGVGAKGKRKRKPEWVSTTAANLEEQSIRDAMVAEKSQLGEQARARRRAKTSHDSSYSDSTRQTSPFHYSPPREYLAPPQDLQETTIEQMTTTVHETRPRPGPSQVIQKGRYRAPKDTWRGFM